MYLPAPLFPQILPLFEKPKRAFMDGFYTGGDILGTLYGHLTGDQRAFGYQADVYGSRGLVGDPKGLSLEVAFPPKLKRTFLEETCKAAGDLCGLALNIPTLGLLSGMLWAGGFGRKRYSF